MKLDLASSAIVHYELLIYLVYKTSRQAVNIAQVVPDENS